LDIYDSNSGNFHKIFVALIFWVLFLLTAVFPYLDARNHEITLLKIKNIRFREKYGEGEIPCML
jgi:hypothetical protein